MYIFIEIIKKYSEKIGILKMECKEGSQFLSFTFKITESQFEYITYRYFFFAQDLFGK